MSEDMRREGIGKALFLAAADWVRKHGSKKLYSSGFMITEGLQRFIDKAKRVTQSTGLTPELVHEFIQKIVVSKPEYRDGKRYQGVEIYYNGVGIIREPSPEEMEELLDYYGVMDQYESADCSMQAGVCTGFCL